MQTWKFLSHVSKCLKVPSKLSMSCAFDDPLDLHAMLKCLVPVLSRTATEVAATTKYLYQLINRHTTRLHAALMFNLFLQLLKTIWKVQQTRQNMFTYLTRKNNMPPDSKSLQYCSNDHSIGHWVMGDTHHIVWYLVLTIELYSYWQWRPILIPSDSSWWHLKDNHLVVQQLSADNGSDIGKYKL